MKVHSDSEAVERMNDSPFGLTAAIWTRDEAAALTLGEQVDTGTWFMNRCDYLDPALAWVGVKDSGRGCTLSVVGLDCLDGTPLRYNQPEPWLPDLLVCRPELTEVILAVTGGGAAGRRR